MDDEKTWPGQDADNVVVDHSALSEFATHIKAWVQAEFDKLNQPFPGPNAVSTKSVPVYSPTEPAVTEAPVETHSTTDVG